MLQSIRDTAQGWIAWVIIILISIPFALWGIQEYLGVGGVPVAATVNGQEISDYDLKERTRAARENLRLSLGESYRPDLFPEADLTRQVLDQIIEEHVMFQAANDMEMAVADASVRGFILLQQGFQQDGSFNAAVYENALRNRGLNTAAYERLVRQDLLLRQFQDAIAASSFVTGRELSDYSRLQGQTRNLDYVVVPASSFMEQVSPSDGDLEAYFQQKAGAYMQPERVKLSYLVLDMETVVGMIEVGDAELESYFEEHRNEFETEDLASARDKVEKAYRRLQAEQVFYDYAERLANQSYEQPDSLQPAAEALGLTIRHSDWLDRSGGEGDLSSVKVVDAAFSEEVMTEGRNSEVLELAPDRLLVLRVQEHQEAQPRQLVDVKDQVLRAYQREKAEELAASTGGAALTRLRDGAGLAGVAAEFGWAVNTDIEATRDNLVLPQEVLDQAFALPRPAEGGSVFAGSRMMGGDYVLVAVTAVRDGELAADDAGRRLLSNQMRSNRGRAEFDNFVAVLRAEADVSLVE